MVRAAPFLLLICFVAATKSNGDSLRRLLPSRTLPSFVRRVKSGLRMVAETASSTLSRVAAGRRRDQRRPGRRPRGRRRSPFSEGEILGGQKPDRHDINSLPVPAMIELAGYPVETHRATTEDGYVLTLHRIPRGRRRGSSSPPVLLLHGILCSSADWVMGEPERSLGYMLADAGYDVWLGNFRGNVYSRDHVNATTALPDSSPKEFLPPMHPSRGDRFWRFSFDEMGRYDVPAMVNLVLSVSTSNSSSLPVVVHSMGSTALMAAAHHRPDFVREKVALMVALAPAARIDRMRTPIRYLVPFQPQIEFLLGQLGQNPEFWTQSSIQARISKSLCSKGPENDDSRRRRRKRRKMLDLLPQPCDVPSNVIFIIAGFDRSQMNMTLLPRILGHTPSGTSVRTLLHYAQIYKSRRFEAYDHGSPESNARAYSGLTRPPEYDLRRADFPSALFWGANDWVATPADVAWLARRLPRVVSSRRVAHPGFNHLDFLWAKDANVLVYEDVVRLVGEFSEGVASNSVMHEMPR